MKTQNRRKTSLSVSEKVLLAAYRAAGGAKNRISFEAIVLQAWSDYPNDFSLETHPEYPDSSIVYMRLYADLIARRLVASLRKRVLRLTDKGIEKARELDKSLNANYLNPKEQFRQLNRGQQTFFEQAIKSRAYRTWQSGKGEDLIDYDVRVFLQFSTGTPIRDRRRKVETAREAIERAVELNIPDSSSLQELLNFMISKYSSLFEEV